MSEDKYLINNSASPSSLSEESSSNPDELNKLVYHKAIELLSRREHSSFEMRHKLLLRFPQQHDSVNEILHRVKAEGYQCDERFTEQYTRMRLNKGFGMQRIALELQQRGVGGNLIAKVEEESIESEALSLSKAWKKKFGKLPEDFMDRAKQYKFLQYRGYRPQQINGFFDTLLNQVLV